MSQVAEQPRPEIYVIYCPKCGLSVPDPAVACPWCLFSQETALTPEEAREFTCAGD
ncbi:MAG TPA: hypothetical protein VED17_06455 [Nitrososphaerales archaeon]|nr:hypothetical protein [Nitrososphaerales archaeon]